MKQTRSKCICFILLGILLLASCRTASYKPPPSSIPSQEEMNRFMEKPSNKADAARILNLLLVENSKVSAFYAMDTNDAGFYSNTPCAIMSFNEHFYTLNCRSVEPPTLSGFLKLHAARVSRGHFGLKYQFEASFKVIGKKFYVITLDFGDRKDAIRMGNRQIAIEVFNQLQYLAAD